MSSQIKQLQNAKLSVFSLNSTGPVSALGVVQLDSTGGIVSGGAGGGSTQVSVREILTSSGVSVMDSTNNSLGVTIRAGSAAGTEYTDGDVDATISGSALLFDNSSNTLRPVTLTRGLPVNLVAGQSTTVNVSSLAGAVIVRSSAAAALMTAYQSTAADFQATVTPASTVWTVQASSLGGRVLVDQNSTVWPVQVSSLAGKVLVDQNSTVWNTQARLFTSSGGSLDGSTTAPAVNAIGLHVRQVLPTRNSTRVLVNIASAGGTSTVVSSQAGLRHRITAFSVTSTVVAASSCAFCSSAAGRERWGLLLGSGSSGVTGANMAVPQPGSIFETDAGEALVFSASSTGDYSVAISYFTEA